MTQTSVNVGGAARVSERARWKFKAAEWARSLTVAAPHGDMTQVRRRFHPE